MLVFGATRVVAFTYSGLFDNTRVRRGPVVTGKHQKELCLYRAEYIVVSKLSGEERLAAGGKAFEEMCSVCHSAP